MVILTDRDTPLLCVMRVRIVILSNAINFNY